MTDKNMPALFGMFNHFKKGGDFDSFVSQYLANKIGKISIPVRTGSFATGGYVSKMPSFAIQQISIDLGGIRTIDDIDLARIVERGQGKRRVINSRLERGNS